jgi:hypothetical protein
LDIKHITVQFGGSTATPWRMRDKLQAKRAARGSASPLKKAFEAEAWTSRMTGTGFPP